MPRPIIFLLLFCSATTFAGPYPGETIGQANASDKARLHSDALALIRAIDSKIARLKVIESNYRARQKTCKDTPEIDTWSAEARNIRSSVVPGLRERVQRLERGASAFKSSTSARARVPAAYVPSVRKPVLPKKGCNVRFLDRASIEALNDLKKLRSKTIRARDILT